MNFFRSEEHLRQWEGYKEKMEGGVIGLDALMQLFGGAYFTQRSSAAYVSHFSEYMADLVGEIDKLPDAGKFWKLSPIEKAAFNLGLKLGII